MIEKVIAKWQRLYEIFNNVRYQRDRAEQQKRGGRTHKQTDSLTFIHTLLLAKCSKEIRKRNRTYL